MGKYVSTSTICKIYGFTVEQLRKWRERNSSPIFKKINGRYYYRQDDVERFINQNDRIAV